MALIFDRLITPRSWRIHILCYVIKSFGFAAETRRAADVIYFDQNNLFSFFVCFIWRLYYWNREVIRANAWRVIVVLFLQYFKYYWSFITDWLKPILSVAGKGVFVMEIDFIFGFSFKMVFLLELNVIFGELFNVENLFVLHSSYLYL